jgi:hypothetical protein
MTHYKPAISRAQYKLQLRSGNRFRDNQYRQSSCIRRTFYYGQVAKEETLRHLSPYLTEHINRFGVYDWNSKRAAPSLDYELKISPG